MDKQKQKEYRDRYYIKNREHLLKKRKERYIRNREKELAKCREWKEKNKEKVNEKSRNYMRERRKNPEYRKKHREYMKEYRKENKEKLSEYNKKYQKTYQKKNKDKLENYKKLNKEKIRISINNRTRKRKNVDKDYVIKCNLRCLLYMALKKYTKTGKTMSSKKYGVDYDKIIASLKPFPEDIKKYNVDHIKPLCSFEFVNEDGATNLEEVRKAFSPDNLRWLLAKDNQIKSHSDRMLKCVCK